MFEAERQIFQATAEEYRTYVADRFSKEDFTEYNEVLFSAHSCAIEGNSFSVDETRALKEHGLGMIPHNKPLVEAFEMLDHFAAYEEMVKTVDAPMTELYVKHLHYLLAEHTIAYRHQGAKPGEYTDTDMCAGDTLFGDHEVLLQQVPRLLDATERQYAEGRIPIVELAAVFHGYFEHLHPFRDGNGRLGRLLVNKLLLQAGCPLLIIEKSQRDEYINALKLFRKESKEFLIAFFYKTLTERMQREIDDKHNATQNFRKGWEGDIYKEY